MKIMLDASAGFGHADVVATNALTSWYDANPAVRRMWVIQPDADESALRVIVMLEPAHDGNEASASWMARGTAWERELGERLARAIQLERIDGPLPDAFEIDGDGVMLSASSWRDGTTLLVSP